MKTPTVTACLLLTLIDLSNAQNSGNSPNKQFAFDFFRQVSANEKGNIFFSPFSLSVAMSMTYAGSEGVTQSQISAVFHLPSSSNKFHSQQGMILERLKTSDSVQLNIANKLWVEKTYPLRKAYNKLMKKAYSASIEQVSFIDKFEDSRILINDNIYKSTNEKIKDLLPSGSLNNLTRMVITNAIYFKGDWSIKFRKEKTSNANFFVTPQSFVKCKMMGVKSSFSYYEDSRIQAIELPYAGNKFSMVIVLPSSNQTLDEVTKGFKSDSLEKILFGFAKCEINISIPKFKLSTGYQLKQALSDMGMPQPFSDDADFSGMTTRNDLKISDVFHKAFIDVNEEGTEASAATAVVIAMKSARNEKFFTANRPFLFFILEKSSGAILFMGRIVDPTRSEQ